VVEDEDETPAADTTTKGTTTTGTTTGGWRRFVPTRETKDEATDPAGERVETAANS
jgi:hypothetical protein